MTSGHVLLFAFLIGLFTGLRSLTPVAITAWATRLHWLRLPQIFAWLGSIPSVALFSILAIAELVADKLPKTPARTAPPGLIARVLFGGFTGACIASAGEQGIAAGIVLGVLGALTGTFAGYQLRTRLVKALGTPDIVVAVLEDLITICGSLWVVSRFS